MQAKKPLLLWGAKGQAKVLYELTMNEYQVVGLIDHDPQILSPFDNVPIYHTLPEFQSAFHGNELFFAVAIGGLYSGQERVELIRMLAGNGYLPCNLIHETAYVAKTAKIGTGNQILAHATVCADASIADGCIINTAASVDHECCIKDSVHLCPGARLLGEVQISSYATIGAGAVILPRVCIGEGAIIGAGSVVLKDVPPYTVMAGTPARWLRNWREDHGNNTH